MSDEMTTAILALAEVRKHPERYRGVAGTNARVGEGPPAIEGIVGDFYVDSLTGDLYRLDAESVLREPKGTA